MYLCGRRWVSITILVYSRVLLYPSWLVPSTAAGESRYSRSSSSSSSSSSRRTSTSTSAAAAEELVLVLV
jgi:hypothetical protein